MKRIHPRDNDYSQLKRKLLFRLAAVVVGSIFGIIAFYFLVWQGRGGDFVLFVLQKFLGMEYSVALDVYRQVFRGHAELLWLGAVLVTFFILLHVVLNWFTRYFAFINQGIGNLLEEESEIRLPPEMAATERKLNAVKGELKRRAREAKMAEQRKNDLVMYLAHDIRTPLSMVMGYAGQLEENPALPEQARKQAAIIRRQSQTIRDLVNDLNLTMRLDCEMQALRKAPLELAPFLRQTAADFLNSGLEHEVDLDLRLPKAPLPRIEADAFLLRRALNNLLLNAARHAPPSSVICLGVTNSVGAADPCGPPSPTCVLWVENQTGQAQAQPSDQDGGAPHGTGRKLVSQIAQAHGGRAVFSDGTRFRGEIWLPVGDKKQALRVWRA